MPTSRFVQLAKFVRVFGAAAGLRLWCSLTYQLLSGSAPLQLRIPGAAAPIYLRSRDLPIFWQIMVMRENKFDTFPQASRMRELYAGMLAAGHRPLIIDCGAHIGLSALWFALRFPEARIYSIEPNSSNFELLQQNTHSYPNVICLHGGVWGRSCDLHISDPNSGSASFRLREVPRGSGGPGLLRGYTVDEICSLDEKIRLFMVKMDIEGGEAAVFEGETHWFTVTPMMLIELHDWLMPGKGTSRSFFQRLAENNFDVVLQGENLFLFRPPDTQMGEEQPSRSDAVVEQV